MHGSKEKDTFVAGTEQHSTVNFYGIGDSKGACVLGTLLLECRHICCT
jgi:hypothetical protein